MEKKSAVYRRERVIKALKRVKSNLKEYENKPGHWDEHPYTVLSVVLNNLMFDFGITMDELEG